MLFIPEPVRTSLKMLFIPTVFLCHSPCIESKEAEIAEASGWEIHDHGGLCEHAVEKKFIMGCLNMVWR